ncbi:MAG: prepilin-type N-terminal cleavage/methylation domain-containing protein [Desulfobacteraceae bacterium]|nr:prepilin-type N-terminal cleavage/methylation domain-containing protein [Desulfobacteraceae bacterium]
MTRRSDRGSTLIELLISLTILGVILLIILGAFRIGVRAWETGERDVDMYQRQQMVFSILKRQLSSACNQSITPEDGDPFVFRGDAESVDFISTVAVVPGNETGNVQVGYRVRSDDEGDGYYIEIMEKNWQPGSGAGKKGVPDAPAAYQLLSGIQTVSFEYLKITPDASEWQAGWNPEKDTGLPAAVRCTVQMDDKKAPVIVVARLLPGMDSR